MTRIEFRYPWDRDRWSCFGVAARRDWALEILEVCRRSHPGCECRLLDVQGAEVPGELVGHA